VSDRARMAVLAGIATLLAGCAGAAPPDPRDAAQAYAEAAKAGDADALYEMLSEEDRVSLSRDEVKALVQGGRDELREHAAAVASTAARTEASAKIRFKDGEQATLVLERGRFRVGSAGTMPGGARSPEEALEQLRRALSRRSYPALLRVLSPATRAAVERDLRSLVSVLEKSGTLPVQVTGDVATMQAPGGHRVKLRRESGVWYVEDFD
jgi:hypothetical protein